MVWILDQESLTRIPSLPLRRTEGRLKLRKRGTKSAIERITVREKSRGPCRLLAHSNTGLLRIILDRAGLRKASIPITRPETATVARGHIRVRSAATITVEISTTLPLQWAPTITFRQTEGGSMASLSWRLSAIGLKMCGRIEARTGNTSRLQMPTCIDQTRLKENRKLIVGCSLVIAAGYCFVKSVHLWPQLVKMVPTGLIGGLCVFVQAIALLIMVGAVCINTWKSSCATNGARPLCANTLAGMLMCAVSFLAFYRTACLLMAFD